MRIPAQHIKHTMFVKVLTVVMLVQTLAEHSLTYAGYPSGIAKVFDILLDKGFNEKLFFVSNGINV